MIACNIKQFKANNWSYTQWEKEGKLSPSFKGFSLYLIKCYNDDEVFLKVGKTFTCIKQRFCNNDDMPYNYEVLGIWQHNAYAISTIESIVKAKFKKYKYTPSLKFKGMHECLDHNQLPAVEEFIKSKLEKVSKNEDVES